MNSVELKSRISANYGWIMVGIASLCTGMAFGTHISLSVFLLPLSQEFGWNRADISLGYSTGALMAGLGGVAMGYLLDRMSIRPLALMGVVSLGLSQVLLSLLAQQWQLYVIYGIFVGALGLSIFMAPMIVTVSFWFEQNRGLAIGITMAGQSLGASVIPFLMRMLIENYGWRQAYLIWGGLCWLLLIPTVLLMRDARREGKKIQAARGGAVNEEAPAASAPLPIRHPRLPIPAPAMVGVLSIAIVCCCICMSIPLVHLVALATQKGLGASSAASLLGVAMASSMIGRVGIGRVADRVGGLRALLLASGGQTAMIFWFTQFDALSSLYLVAVGYGIAYGGVVPSYAMTIREQLPVALAGRATGIVFLFGNTGMALGGFLGGAIFDYTGTYTWSFAAGAIAGIVNLLIVGSLYTHGRRLLAYTPALRTA